MSGSARVWAPTRFADYGEVFPATPALPTDIEDVSSAFRAHFAAAGEPRTTSPLAGAEVVLVRGFLGNWMPGNLVAVRDRLRQLGADCWIARSPAGGTVTENAGRILSRLCARDSQRPLWLLGHSRGGLEAQRVALDPRLRDRLVGVIAAQCPAGPSAVLESMLTGAGRETLANGRRRAAEWSQRVGLALIGARRGGLGLTGDALRREVAAIRAAPPPCPVLHMASWSVQPTSWLDSFHERLGELRPGCAHDGQFFLEDLIWPGRRHALLARVDHAQPAMGGFGFDPARFWLAMAATLRSTS